MDFAGTVKDFKASDVFKKTNFAQPLDQQISGGLFWVSYFMGQVVLLAGKATHMYIQAHYLFQTENRTWIPGDD